LCRFPSATQHNTGLTIIFGWQNDESAIQRDGGSRADGVDDAPELVRRTGVAARAHHLIEAGGA
jgi:hypothetical protein